MTKTRPFLSMCYGDPSATEVPPCCETATKKLTFSTTSVLLLLNMPLSLSRATIFRRQKNPRRVYRPKIAGILFVCNEPEGKYYTVPRCCRPRGHGRAPCALDREAIPLNATHVVENLNYFRKVQQSSSGRLNGDGLQVTTSDIVFLFVRIDLVI